MKNKIKTLIHGLTVILTFLPGLCEAQTVITGPNITTSTWGPSGNPYVIASDCTVVSGNTLTIQPGTVVWMGSGVSLTGNGMISAVGTSAQHITFQAPVSSQFWNTIIVNNTTGTNQFTYCDFQNATNALDFRGAGNNVAAYCTFSNIVNAGIVFRDNSISAVSFCTFQSVLNGIWMTVAAGVQVSKAQTNAVLNCNFTNCSSQSIYGEAIGSAGHGSYEGWASDATLATTIKNCSFSSSAVGCWFAVSGAHNTTHTVTTGYGYGNAQIQNNTFNNITNSAIRLSVGSYPGGGPATLINNTIVNAGSGIVTQDPWDAKIQNNIFKSCASAVTRSGSLSATASYNDFYGNTANFTGYPVTYGQVLLVNRNGTPSDVLYNIFPDPLLTSASDFHLQGTSPCIDAGESSGANLDSYFPPSLGTTYNDIGTYGGPNAGQWIIPASTNAFILTAAEIPYVSVTINPPTAGHYRLEYSSTLLGTNTWIQITNLDLTATPFTYTEPATSPSRFYRAVLQ